MKGQRTNCTFNYYCSKTIEWPLDADGEWNDQQIEMNRN